MQFFWPQPNRNPCFRSFGNGWFHLGKSFLCWWSHGSPTWIPWWKWTHWKKYHYSIRNRAQITHAKFPKISQITPFNPTLEVVTWNHVISDLWLWKDNINCAEIECNSLKLNFNVCTAGFGCESRFVAAACPCGRDLKTCCPDVPLSPDVLLVLMNSSLNNWLEF